MDDAEAHAVYLEGDVLIIGMGASRLSWTLTIELHTGRGAGTRKLDDQPVEELTIDFTGADLILLQDAAADLFMEGDMEHHEQFARAGVEFRVVIDGDEVKASFGVEGALPVYDDVYMLVSRRVLHAD